MSGSGPGARGVTLDAASRGLLKCLRGEPEAAWLPAAGDVEAWGALVERAARAGLAPWLYAAVRGREGLVAEPARTRLYGAYWQTVARNCRMLHQLEAMARALSSANIPLIVLKGGALLERAYPDVGTRPMSDVDLLVRGADVDRAAAVLTELGYGTTDGENVGHSAEFVRAYGGEMAFRSADPPGVVVELHWQLIHYEGLRDLMPIDYEALWRRARRVDGSGGALELSAEDTILYLALHLALHHRLADVRLYFDVDRLCRAEAVDWGALADRARGWRCRGIAYVVLRVCGVLFDTPMPAELLAALRPWAPRRALLSHLVRPEAIAAGRLDPGARGERLLHLFLADQTRGAARYLGRTFWPEARWIRLRYGLNTPGEVRRQRLYHLRRMAGYGLESVRDLVHADGGKEISS